MQVKGMDKQQHRDNLLSQIVFHISQAQKLQEIFDTACHGIQQFLQSDRVAIFQFNEDSYDDGVFVAESVSPGFTSVLTQRVQDHSFGDSYADLYFKGQYRAIDDIYAPEISPCHIEILEKFQIKANLVIPVILRERLWGLLCIHQCANKRHWENEAIELTQELAQHVAIAIQQAILIEQLKNELKERKIAEQTIKVQAHRERLTKEISQKISQSLELQEIFDTSCSEIQAFMKVDRVAIFEFESGSNYNAGTFVAETVNPEYISVLTKRVEDHSFGDSYAELYFKGKYRAIDDIYSPEISACHINILEQFEIKANLVIPIILKESLWGLLCIHQCRQAHHWEAEDVDLIQQLANQLAIAIQQAQLYKKVQKELLEHQQTQTLLSNKNQELAISNKELAKATRMKDEFLANTSHELRTPLNAILGMTEIMIERGYGEITAKQDKALKTVEKSAKHLLDLINDILDLAKIESGQSELEYSSVSISSLCHSSLSFIKQQAINKDIEIEVQIPFTLPDIQVDQRKINQVLINLLTNAVKFTPENGKIRLEVSLQKKMIPTKSGEQIKKFCRFAVIDNGIGISEEHIQGLFQPFIQVDSALNRSYSGTGLGLALVKRITEMHQGSVSVQSDVNVGSCFNIDLPLIETDEPPDQTSPLSIESLPTPVDQSNHKPLILIVEDNEANINTLSDYLEMKGYRRRIAKNGKEGIELAKSCNPDLILMDIQMPEVDGLSAMREIRKDPKLVNLPIIALTSLAMLGDRETCLEAGATDYLSKPIRLKELVLKIKENLSLS